MTTYLTGGWYNPGPEGGLRTEVLDGAIDAAGLLHRASVSPALVSRLAMRVRGLARVGDAGTLGFGPEERDIIARRLDPLVGDSTELASFIADCLDHVHVQADLMAFYLHLVHVTRMMALLALAQLGPPSPPAGAGGSRAAARPRPARRRKTSASTRAAKAPRGGGAQPKRGAPTHRAPKSPASKRKRHTARGPAGSRSR